MAKKDKKAEQMEKQIQSFIGTPAGSVLIAGAAAVFLLPFAVQYLVKAAEDQALPYASMLGSKVGNAIKDHAKETAQKLKEIKAEKWHEANPDITTTEIDIQQPGTSDKEVWIKNMKLPPSSVLLKKPFDKTALNIYNKSGQWNYYGVYTINNNPYWLIIPKNIELYRTIEYKQFTTERQPQFCEQHFENFTEYPECYDVLENQELVWPTRWPPAGGL